MLLGLSDLQDTYGVLYREMLESLAACETCRVLGDGARAVETEDIVLAFFSNAFQAVKYDRKPPPTDRAEANGGGTWSKALLYARASAMQPEKLGCRSVGPGRPSLRLPGRVGV